MTGLNVLATCCVLLVLSPIVAPIQAAARQLIVVAPGEGDYTLVVVSADGQRAIRHAACSDADLLTVFGAHSAAGIVRRIFLRIPRAAPQPQRRFA